MAPFVLGGIIGVLVFYFVAVAFLYSVIKGAIVFLVRGVYKIIGDWYAIK